MPTYQYRCTECSRDLEVVQKFSDAALTECPTCSGSLRKVFNAVGVVFKGSGFYRNDSRAKESTGATADKGSSVNGGSDSGSTNGKKADTKDAPATATSDGAASPKKDATPKAAAPATSGAASS